ncbi:MAG: serine/threonine-protein kinase [Vicinamibacterales bacterium]
MKRPLDAIVADIADDVSVDWSKVGETSDSRLRQFKIIALVGAGRQATPAESRAWRAVRAVLAVAVALAAIKIVFTVLAIATTEPFRIGPKGVIVVAFGLFGGCLLWGGQRDIRALALGGLFILIGSTFGKSYLERAIGGPVGTPALWLTHLAPEAMLGAALWAFTWVFPSQPRSVVARRLGRWGIALSLSVGGAAALATTVGALVPAETFPTVAAVLRISGRGALTSMFWPVLLTSSALALPYLVWKSLAGTVEDRTRVGFLALAIVVCVSPMVLAGVAWPFLPALATPWVRDAVGFSVYLAMGALVPAAAYAVLVRKVLDVHLVIRKALQHALARRVVWLASVAPLIFLSVSLYAGRDRTLRELASEQFGMLLISAVGFGVLTFRAQLLTSVDRWFMRGGVDYADALSRLVESVGAEQGVRGLQSTLLDQISRTLHSSTSGLVLLNDSRTAFVSLGDRLEPLSAASALAGLAGTMQNGLQVPSDAMQGVLQLLPESDRTWAASTGAEWLFPLNGSNGSLVGVLCLGPSLSGLPYSPRDRAFVSAATSQVALRLENLSLRSLVQVTDIASAPSDSFVDWQNEAGMQCPACGIVGPPDARQCECEATMVPAAIPAVLNGKFHIERVLGSGGMGVVYSAIDADLKRRVAIKSMPAITPRHVARLQREAQAMASVGHPNLATIFSVEKWRDVPLLVVEHLEGGTLAEGLRAGPMSADDVLELGIVLADALDCMHQGGLLHRDIKPSNIGYSGDGVVKLLDFGLAAMLDGVSDEVGGDSVRSLTPRAWTAMLEAFPPNATVTFTQHLVGTPLYLSPEAIAGDEPDQSFDLWSLGLVLYEALAGRHPLAGLPSVEVMRRVRSVRLPDVRDFQPDCPAPLATFLYDALSLVRERRPASAADFRMKLQTIRPVFTGTSQTLRGHSLY